MKSWLFLSIAIVTEVIATSALKASEGFTRAGPSVLVVAGYGVAFYCLSLTLRSIPVGIAYAVWSGVGIVLITGVAWLFFGQRLDAPAIVGMALIVAGVIVINAFSASVAHEPPVGTAPVPRPAPREAGRPGGPMSSDEEQIRGLIATWMAATRAGEVDAVLALMTDDVVFLAPGRPPMGKAEFAAAARAQAGPGAPAIDGSADLQEVLIAGDWAFAWSRLSVAVTPADGSEPLERAGHALTVFHRRDGRWLLARDANMLSPVPRPEA